MTSVPNGPRALCVVTAVACAVLIGAAPVASAQTGCAPGLALMSVPDVLRTLAAPGSETAIRAADVNADGYLCVQVAPGGGLAQFTDNNQP